MLIQRFQLNYKPNLIARSLKLRSTKSIGLIFPDLEDPFYSFLVNKAEEVAYNDGYNVILCHTEYKLEKEKLYIEILKKKFIDGYLIIPIIKNAEHYEFLKNEKVVTVDRSSGMKNEILIKTDNNAGVNSGVEYLISLGHKRIGVINLPLNMTTGFERVESYKRTLSNHNIKLNDSLIKFAEQYNLVESSYDKTLELLKLEKSPTAIFPMNGPTTIGALKAIKKLNLRIPDDISIIGFDELFFAELLDPPLTTIAQPVYELGTTGMKTLLKIIKSKKYKRNQVFTLQPKLIVRNSCKDISN